MVKYVKPTRGQKSLEIRQSESCRWMLLFLLWGSYESLLYRR